MKTLTDEIISERQKMAIADKERDKGIDLNPIGIVQKRNLIYGQYQQHCDIYYPDNQCEAPIIINIHGGGWFYGDKQLYRPYCLQLAKEGFIVVNFDYRLAPEYPFPAALDDVDELFHWVGTWRRNQSVFIIGDSAGASIALQYVTIQQNTSFRNLFPYSKLSYPISKVILYCGIYFLEHSFTINEGKLKTLRHAYLPDEIWKKNRYQLRPEQYITRDFPPLMLITGSDDFLREDTMRLHEYLNQRGIEHVMKEYHDESDRMGHVFELDQRKKQFLSILHEATSFLKTNNFK